ncbi:sporulation protein YunB [Virgibacillus salexigens]|uniref:Sporulation protein YunB n=2 Tax=Virgibacillus TaxID=84406 RepID=A0A024QAD4_9BACI|nr:MULTISPECIES: sporulation protein YunB [Virgibacillus]MYL40072.1 sporulation protein YunB [Virgibacillus massiliensis]GGJ62377.1 sporulation protein YunB [Virgibacillus kapii]CDQ39185.1 Sporulation protein YunB [Virgibacillus massiliensis]
MGRRPRFKLRTTSPVKVVFLMTTIAFVILTSLSIIIVDKGITPPLMEIANQKTQEFATRTINEAVKSTENISFDDLMEVTTKDNGSPAIVGWKSSAVNRALRTATKRAEYFLYGMNKGETLNTDDPDMEPQDYGDTANDLADKDPTVVEIPIGQATGSTILSNLGPKVPVHFEIVGSIQSDVEYEVKKFGINAVLIEIYIPVTVNAQIVVPFTTEPSEISTRVYVDSRVLMGDVPDFYGGDEGGPNISVPKDDLNNN